MSISRSATTPQLAFDTIHPDEMDCSACLALQAVRYDAGLGSGASVSVLTDKGAYYRLERFVRLCRRLGLKHRLTKQ